MMDMNVWNDLCFRVNKLKSLNASEKAFQNAIELSFEKLGWSSYQGEIQSQVEIHIGANNRLIPDIVIQKDGKNILVIELKKPDLEPTARYQEQLFSYMRQLKIKWGLFIGASLQFFFDAPDGKDAIEIFETKFDEGNEDALDFLSLLCKENFDEGKLLEFCKQIIKDRENKMQARQIIKQLSEDAWKKKFYEMLRLQLIESYGEKIAEIVLSEISVEITVAANKEETALTEPNVIQTGFFVKPQKDTTRYSVDGEGKYNKKDLVLKIIKDYVNKNSHLTFQQIKKAFPDYPQTKTICLFDSIDPNSDKAKKRYFMDKALSSADKIKFVVSTQWGKPWIDDFIDNAKKLGYRIEYLKNESKKAMATHEQWQNPQTAEMMKKRDAVRVECDGKDLGEFTSFKNACVCLNIPTGTHTKLRKQMKENGKIIIPANGKKYTFNKIPLNYQAESSDNNNKNDGELPSHSN
jgi:hypothetical protein